jgi:hypothetical protein
MPEAAAHDCPLPANSGRSTIDAVGQWQSLQDLDAALPNSLYGNNHPYITIANVY